MSIADLVAKEEPKVSRSQRHFIAERYSTPYATLAEAMTAARKASLKSYDGAVHTVYQSVKSVQAKVEDDSCYIEVDVKDVA